MEQTVRLYEQQPYCQNFTAAVAAVDKEKRRVALTATCFYPEGGGQPGDTGTLTLGGRQVQVTDTHIAAGVIWHSVSDLPPVTPGDPAEGAIDWPQRFDRMQQHTGEHVLQGILYREYGAANVGFHIGGDAVRMDIPIELTAQQLARGEQLANEAIWQNLPIRCWYPAPEELDALDYRSKKVLTDPVRLVEIPGVDLCACCGTHLAATGELGCIKIRTAERYKGGMRLTLLCGSRAYQAFVGCHDRQAEIGALLSADAPNTALFVRRLYQEHQALKFAHVGLQNRLFEALAAAAPAGQRAVVCVEGLDGDGLHRLAGLLAEKTGTLAAAFTPQPGGGHGYCMAELTGKDLRPVCKAFNQTFNGRGGGKPAYCQGSTPCTDFSALKQYLEEISL